MSYSLKGEMLTGTVHGKQTLEGQGFPRGNDGISPTVEVTENENGHRVAITDVSGTKAFDVRHGKEGNPGYTPQKGIDYFDGKDGYTPVKGVDYFDGEKGDKGDTGFAPEVDLDQMADGVAIRITTEGGAHTAIVRNGRDGKDGVDGEHGYTPVKGKDYFDGKDGVSATHSWNGTTLTVKSASGTSSVDLKGDKGDAFTYEDFTEEQLSALKGEAGQEGIGIASVTFTKPSPSMETGALESTMSIRTARPDGSGESHYSTKIIHGRDGKNGVQTVNGVSPDASGNVQIEVGSGSGVEVTAKPGQLIRVKEVDRKGNPMAWEAVPWGYTEGETIHPIPGELLPEGVPYVEEGWLLEETDAEEGTDDTFGKVWCIDDAPSLKFGETYEIIYNGVSYTCVAQAVPPGMIDDPGAAIMGNLSALGGENTGEPFLMAHIPSLERLIALDFTGAASVKIGIIGKVVQKLDPRCLPSGGATLYDVPFEMTIADNGITASTEMTFTEIYTKATTPGAIVRAVLYMSGVMGYILPIASCRPDRIAFTYADHFASIPYAYLVSVDPDDQVYFEQKSL